MSPFERQEQYDAGEHVIEQGPQIFVDELKRFATEVADSRCAAIADRLAAPLRVAVSGRRGVGRSTLARALARIANVRGTIAVTCTESAEADVDVHRNRHDRRARVRREQHPQAVGQDKSVQLGGSGLGWPGRG